MNENIQPEMRVGVFLCHCGHNIAGVLNIQDLGDFSARLPGVVKVAANQYTCSEPGQQEIIKLIRENELNRVVVAGCSPKLHEETFRKCLVEAGLNPFLMEMVNVREHVSWVHEHEGAQAKAKDMVAAAVARVHLLEPLEYIRVPVTKKALVIGGGIAGLEAALDLADAEVDTVLVERSPSVGGRMAQLCKTFPTMDCPV